MENGLRFYYEFAQGTPKNRIIKVQNMDGKSININWKLSEEDNTEESIEVCNFIIEVACSCRGIEGSASNG